MSAEAVINAWNLWCLHHGAREFKAKGVSDEEVAARLASFIKVLEDIPDPIMEAAAYQCLAQYDWFPTIHQVRETAAKLVQPSRRSAAEAWAIVQRKLHDHAPQWDDPVIAATVQTIGLYRLRTDENESALFAQFRDTYDTLRTRQRESLISPPIVHQLIGQAVKRMKEGKEHERLKPPQN